MYFEKNKNGIPIHDREQIRANNVKNDRKVRLVVKKYDNFKQIPTFKWKSNNND